MSMAMPDVAGRVVVGTDGSEHAARAVSWAAAYASRRDAGLTIVRVAPHVPVPKRLGVYSLLSKGTDYLKAVEDALRSGLDVETERTRSQHPELDVQAALIEGHAADLLGALSGQALCVVLGATGASRMRGALLGGTAVAVVHAARGSVVIIPDGEGYPSGPVIVGLDDSEGSAAVVRAAIDEAVRSGRSLKAFYAWDIDPALGGAAIEVMLRDEREIIAEGHAMLERLTAGAPQDLAVERVVEMGRAGAVLATASRRASLMVVGSHGHGGLTGLLLGSVSRSVLLHSACPVMVVRTKSG